MCITFFVKDFSPEYPLIIAFNRDESVFRESTSLSRHSVENGYEMYYAMDVHTGATWFGINKETGNFAFLTNHRFHLHKHEDLGLILKQGDSSNLSMASKFLKLFYSLMPH